jgi:hypothetical protein
MTGTDYTLFTHKSVPVIFEPPCTYVRTLRTHIRILILLRSWALKGLGCQRMVSTRVSSSMVSSSHSEHKLLILRLTGYCVFKDSII